MCEACHDMEHMMGDVRLNVALSSLFPLSTLHYFSYCWVTDAQKRNRSNCVKHCLMKLDELDRLLHGMVVTEAVEFDGDTDNVPPTDLMSQIDEDRPLNPSPNSASRECLQSEFMSQIDEERPGLFTQRRRTETAAEVLLTEKKVRPPQIFDVA